MGPKRAAPRSIAPPKPKSVKTTKASDNFTIILDTQILNESYGSNLTAQLAENHLKYQVRNQLIPQSVSFERQDPAGDLTEEHVLLVILKGCDVISWIESDTLISTIKSYSDMYGDKQISLLIFGFRCYLRGTNTKLSRLKIETELTRLQLHTTFSHRLIEKPVDLIDTVVHFGKSIAEIPVKRLKNKAIENENFYFANDNRDCVKVVGQVGLGRLWQQHLMKLPSVTLETAEAIVAVYPTPKSLFDAFRSSCSPETVLRDVPIRRDRGPLTTNRLVGGEMSRKIFLYYQSVNSKDQLS